MSRFSAQVNGEGEAARVSRDEGLASLDGEFHVTRIEFGSLRINLTDREARRLWEDLGEIYASQTPGEVETPEQIAERISTQRSIGGFGGLTDNTRRITRAAALQAAKAARGLRETAPPARIKDTRRLDPHPFRSPGIGLARQAHDFPGAIFQPGIDFNQDRSNYPNEIFDTPEEADK